MPRQPHASWAPLPLLAVAVSIAAVVVAAWLTCT